MNETADATGTPGSKETLRAEGLGHEGRVFKLGTRRSELALWQAHHVRDRLIEFWGDELKIELVEIVTEGDRILDKPLALIGGKGLFVNGIEERLLSGEVDFAVHSMKDLPSAIPEELVIECTPERADPRDALVGAKGVTLAELPPGTRVGTSSLRRSSLTRRLNPEVEVVSIRGNVPTRVSKIEAGICDVVLLAAAGLERLGMADVIAEYLDPEAFIPAATQGILALECRENDALTRRLISALHDDDAATMAECERAFLARLEGGCQVPMGCHARLEGGEVVANAMVGDPSGRPVHIVRERASRGDAAGLGVRLAEALLELGAGEIIESLAAAQAHGRDASH